MFFIFKAWITLSLSISALFKQFLGLGCIAFGIRALSSGLASAKRVILAFSLQLFFYKDSEIKIKNPLLKQAELSPTRNSYPDPLQFQT